MGELCDGLVLLLELLFEDLDFVLHLFDGFVGLVQLLLEVVLLLLHGVEVRVRDLGGLAFAFDGLDLLVGKEELLVLIVDALDLPLVEELPVALGELAVDLLILLGRQVLVVYGLADKLAELFLALFWVVVQNF